MSASWHILTSEYPPDVGGVSNYTHQVALALTASGDEVHVWCPRQGEGQGDGVHVHPDLGRMAPADLRRVDEGLGAFPAPRRLLVQWVPHGYGFHSMNLWFCVWLAKRAWSGDRIELMVHEPFLEFRRGPLRHLAMACVHRLMTIVLLGAARKVWISIPAWERRLRPYALGRTLPMQWLPIPGGIADDGVAPATSIRAKYVSSGGHLLGHFGSYGRAVTDMLVERLPPIMDGPLKPSVLLLGAGGEGFRDALVLRYPWWKGRVHAAGYLPSSQLSAHISACDLFVQPYPDGITSRRTSALACLSLARPVVTTAGHLTEPLWNETNAVAIAAVADTPGFARAAVDLLGDDTARLALADRGQRLSGERFSLSHVVNALRAA